jgi:hypothetical protein
MTGPFSETAPTRHTPANFVRKTTRGPRPLATADQVARVLDLRADGRSLRGTADVVFGDRRLYGRVRRLLVSTRPKTADERAADRDVADALAVILEPAE